MTTTTYFVDYEGAAGLGDGSSYANRAQKISDITGAGANDLIKVKKSSDATTVGNATVLRRPSYSKYSLPTCTLTKSTSEGESSIAFTSHGLSTGDWVYLQNATAGQGINGIWKVTRVDNNNFKLQGYTGTADSGTVSSIRITFLGSSVVELASAVTKTIASTGPRNTTWTASSNVTTSMPYSYSEWTGSTNYLIAPGSDEIDIAAGFGTGKAAYFATGTLDLSGYQQISFYVNLGSGPYTDNLSLRLCTDVAGDTTPTDHTAVIKLTEIQKSDRWVPLTVDLGANLNSAIKSIALYVDSDEEAQKIRLHNIIACKASSSADSLTLNSVIGLDTVADPQWYGIFQIDDKSILLAHALDGKNVTSYYTRFCDRWSATNASASLKKRQPVNHHTFTSGANTALDASPGSGDSSNFLTISGGWDPSDSMGTQNGETFIDCVGPNGYGLNLSSKSHVALDKLSYIRGRFGIYVISGSRVSFDNIHSICPSNRPLYISNSSLVKLNYTCTGSYSSLYLTSTSNHSSANTSDFNVYIFGEQDVNGGITIQSSNGMSFNLINVENLQSGIDLYNSSGCTINTVTGGNCSRHNGSSISPISLRQQSNNLTVGTLNAGDNYYAFRNNACKNFVINNFLETTVGSTNIYNHYESQGAYTSGGGTTTINNGSSPYKITADASTVKTYSLELTGGTEYTVSNGGVVHSSDHDNVSGAIKNIYDGAIIIPESSIRKTASGVSWKASITNSSKYTAGSPLAFDIAKVVCAASALVTVKIWVYRSSTNIFGGLFLPSNYTLGLTSSSSIYGTGSATTWEEKTLTFTPSAAGTATIQAAFYAVDSSSSVYIDDISITQA